MGLTIDSLEAGFLVEVAGGAEFALGPEHHLLIAGLAAEADAFGDQATA
jgi:hypothetical protein